MPNTHRRRITLTGVALCAALIGGFVSPAQGAPSGPADPADPAAALVGGFAVGDGAEAVIDERDGALQLAVAAAGLEFEWNSQTAGATSGNAGLGGGWRLALGGIDTDGGVRVRSKDGLPHELDSAHVSGLYGYGGHDLRFESAAGELPGRDGRPEPVAYRYVLHELGGQATYFDEAGHPVAQIVATTADRTDWGWQRDRLTRVVSPEGVITDLDWQGAPRTLLIRPAANVTASGTADADRAGQTTGPSASSAPWRLELTAGRIDTIVDPTGGRTEFGYTDGLLTGMSDPMGAQTEISWQTLDDGLPRVGRVRVADHHGVQLSERTWSRHGDTLPSRWPADPGHGAITPSLRHTTEVSDGHTVVRSTYSALGTLQERRVLVTTANGTLEPQTQRFTYPADGLALRDLGALPPNWSRPATAEATYRDQAGGARTTTEQLGYDDFGRLVRRVDRLAAAGDAPASVTTTAYRYDALSRLVGSTRHDGPGEHAAETERTEYRVNVRGDIEAETVTRDPGSPGERTTTREFAYSALGELTAITTDGVRREQAWDAAGNLVRTADGATIAYDAANRPVSTTRDGVTTATEYWPDGTRRSLTTTHDATGDATRIDYYWDDGELLTELHSGPQVGGGGRRVDASGPAPDVTEAAPAPPAGSAGYLLGLGRLARTVDPAPPSAGTSAAGRAGGAAGSGDPATVYYGTDRHANVTDLTDESGQPVVRYAYSDYGVATATSLGEPRESGGDLARNPFGFAGELTDRDGTQPLGPRVYDAASMRFGSKDPEPVVSPYAFAALNPVMMADPTGHMPEWDVIINGVLAGVGLIVSVLTFAMMSAPFAGAPMGLWVAYGISWAAEIGNLFATVTAGVQLANDLLPQEQQFISEADSEILTWTALGVAAVSFVSGIAAAKYVGDMATDFHATLKAMSDDRPQSYLLRDFHAKGSSTLLRRSIAEGVYENIPKMRAKWTADAEAERRLLTQRKPTASALKDTSESSTDSLLGVRKGETTALTPEACRESCNTAIHKIKSPAAKSLADSAVAGVTHAAKHTPTEQKLAMSVYQTRMDAAYGVKRLTEHDRNLLDSVDASVRILQWG